MCCDISSVILQRLAKSDKRREMIQADGFILPYKKNSIDIIVDKGTMDSISCDSNHSLSSLFQELYRVLQPGGKYIAITPWNAPKRVPQLKNSQP
eukprot:UN07343